MKILILEDNVYRHHKFRIKFIGHLVTIVETVYECIDALESDEFDAICLDHDLGEKEMVNSGDGTGYEVAVWLTKNKDRTPKHIYIHSCNPVGAKNMKNVLESAGYSVIYSPRLWMDNNTGV